MEDFRMLVLTRKLGEKILIGDDIVITVVDLGDSRMKLGIEAPAKYRILRSELDPNSSLATEPVGRLEAVNGMIARTRSRSKMERASKRLEPVGA
jgi:carbon storage regulator